MAARKRTWTPDIVRSRIRTAMLMKRLQRYALGESDQGKKVELSRGQIRAIEILLKKAVPDLSSVEHSGEMSYRSTTELSDAVLSDIATGSGAGAVETTDRTPEPDAVH